MVAPGLPKLSVGEEGRPTPGPHAANSPRRGLGLTTALGSWLFDAVKTRLSSSALALAGLTLSLGARAAEPGSPDSATPPPSAPAASSPVPERVEREIDGAKKRLARASKRADLAPRLTALITEWGKVRETLVETARLEAEATELENEILELEASTRRAKLLVEQTEARRARALLRLRELKLEPEPTETSPPNPTPVSTTNGARP